MSEDNKNGNYQSVKKLKLQFVKYAFHIAIAVVVIVAFAMAWFASNSNVSGTSSQISATSPVRFQLASMGTLGRYDKDSYTENIDEKMIDGKTYYCSNGKIVAWMSDYVSSPSSGIMNEEKSTVDEEDILRPGSSGQITFYIIPEVDDLESVTINLSLTPYVVWDRVGDKPDNSIDTVMYVKQKDGSFLKSEEVASPMTTGNDNDAVSLLLGGHILFFQSADGQVYSDWIKDGRLTISPESGFNKDTPYAVTINWVWPLQFDSYVTNSSDQVKLFAGLGEWSEFKTDIIENTGKYLVGDYTESTLNQIVQGIDESNKKIAQFRLGYNDGDQMIGKNIQFVMLQVLAN